MQRCINYKCQRQKVIIMRMLIFAFAMFFLQGSCEKRGVETTSTIDGVYKGIFGRSSPTAKYASSNVTLTIKGNQFSGQSDHPNYPAICSGTFKVEGASLVVENDCMFTADFDWSLIFKGEHKYEMNGNELIITKGLPNSIQDRFVLTKQ
jgi:hypothetical protein